MRNGALFSVFSFINKGFSFILLMVMANLMPPAEYGYLNLFNTIVVVTAVFIALSTEGYLPVAFFQDGELGAKRAFSVIFCISSLIMMFLIGCIFFCNEYISSVLEIPNNLLVLAILICFFTAFNNLLLDFFRIKEKIKAYGYLSCSCALMNLILSIFCIKVLQLGWPGRVYAQFVCMLSFGSIGICYFFHHKFFTFDIPSYYKQVLIWSIPLIPHLATNFIRQGCDRYIINYYHTISDVGLFSFALTLVNIITMIGFGFNQANSVDIYKTLSDANLNNAEKKSNLFKQRRLFIRLYCITTVIAVAAGGIIVPVIMPKYVDAIKYFFILAVYGFGICIYLVYTNYLFYYKKTKLIMYITFGTAILHLSLSLFFTRFGLIYTAMLYGFTQIIVVLLIRHFSLKTIDRKLVAI